LKNKNNLFSIFLFVISIIMLVFIAFTQNEIHITSEKMNEIYMGDTYEKLEQLNKTQTVLTLNRYTNLVTAVILLIFSIIIYKKDKINTENLKKATKDNLTGLNNRHYFSYIEKNIDLHKYVIVLCDIDFFKRINDIYTHDAGDEVLKQISKKLEDNLRENNDFIIRWGGEEFLLLLKKDKLQDEKIIDIIERIREDIASTRITLPNKEIVNLTMSFGLNLRPYENKNFEDAINLSDELLYKAKNSGRNRVESSHYDDNTTTVLSISKIRDILESNDVHLNYYPVVSKNNKILFHESYVKLKYNNKIINPSEFMHIISGSTVYSEFIKKIIGLNIKAIEDEKLNVAVNIEISDLKNDSIYEFIVDILNKKTIPKLYISISNKFNTQINVSKDILLNDRISFLRKMNVEFILNGMLDDFNILKIANNYKIEFLKIDSKKLIKEENFIMNNLIQTLNQLKKENNSEVILSFVTDKKELELFKNLKWEYSQGSYLNK
jgi:diguanylate cyclase (GGDEF)-like protein